MASTQDRVLKRTLPSSLKTYQEFIAQVIDELDQLGWDRCHLFGVEMALEESISNAIRHGTKEDPAKQVDVECRLSAEHFWARVCDEGVGFEPAKVPDCCAPDRLEVPGGRGLALMRAYMSGVHYNDRGNCVTIEKRLPASPG
jgi:serine/threonine-protein kinase RsbW